MHPIAFHASLHQWQLFVTLTYESRDERGNALKVPDEAGRRKMLFAFLRRAGFTKRHKVQPDLNARMNPREYRRRKEQAAHGEHVDRVPFKHLLWMAREERGELGGRYHYHILLGGLCPFSLNKSTCFALKGLWTSIGGGFADVRLFDTSLPGVKYVMKGLNEWSPELANAYEMRKAGVESENRELILAECCVRQWAQQSTKPGATKGGTCNRLINRASPSDRRELVNHQRTKETPQELEERIRSSWLNAHPAGVSFVR